MLPQGDIDQEWLLEHSLHQMVREVLEDFIGSSPPESKRPWTIVASMLENWMETEKQGTPCKDALTSIISNIRNHGATALYIRAQNCGWIAYYGRARDMLIFDAFEASPRGENVLSAQGSLLRSFPGQSVAIPADRLDDTGFCSCLGGEISHLSVETVDEMVPTTKKAGVRVLEGRDTAHPGLITEGLMIQLLALGRHNDWPCFDKHMRDEVNWRDSRLPWRRSPYWFVMRVALQTVLRRAFADAEGQRQYKNFMLYLVAHVALRANDTQGAFSADQLQIVRAKMARRISKLGDEVDNFVARRVLSAESAIKTRLEGIQTTIQEADSTIVPERFTCSEQDLQLTLHGSSGYLQAALSQSPTETEISQFNRPGDRRNQLDNHGLPILRSNDILSILDFERWLEHDMSRWAETSSPTEDLICVVADRFRQYNEYGTQFTAGIPEAASIMRLAQLELWVTFDRMCIALCPLLREYSPEVPVDFLEPLLLPQRCQMRRANEIEIYLKRRHQDHANGSIFRDPESRGFAVAYYESSDSLTQLRQRIEKYAQGRVEEKRREWISKKNKYNSLKQKAREIQHRYEENWLGHSYHASPCKKCTYENQASQIFITIYEWPLPENDSDLKTVLFELVCPRWFAAWRDVTWTIVQDFGRRQLGTATNMEQNLLKYDGARQFTVTCGQRLTLGSTTKSWHHTHYSRQHFPVDFEEISLPNALRFKLLDSSGIGWVADQRESPTIKPLCTLHLPQGAYSNLQYAVSSSRHTQNQVLAGQTNCDPTLNLHEFVAFSGLRAGERVQWYNILRELASPTLSLNEESVGILIRQAAWALGKSSHGTDLREAHRVFEDVAFTDRLLETLEHRLNSIEANWNEHQTLHTLIVIGLRVLSLSEVDSLVERAAAFMRRGRQVTMRWIENLITTLDSQTGTQGQAQQQMLVRVGQICQLTYSVELHKVPVLLRSTDDLFHLIRASVVVFENTPPRVKGNLSAPNVAWVQTARILHHVEGECIGPGELLIDNAPPGRLPEDYTRDLSFHRLFGLRTFTVLPSNLAGSRFMSARHFKDFQVYFGMENNCLVVKAKQGSEVLRYVPHDQLKGDFPESLLSGYAHWLSLQDGTLEFRPLVRAWQPDSSNWRLSMNFAVMTRPRCTMVDVRSRLYVDLSRILMTLDKPDHMVVYQTPEDTAVIEMVRLRLRFLVNRDGVLESPELNATVDQNQDIGCFYGLKNKLVLRAINEPGHRSVLIPYGDARLSKQRYHTAVRIEPPQETRVRYFRYSLDPHLQELRGPGDMLEALYQAYMHALTGFVLADPATHRPGTAEALRILRQARLRSSLPLEQECMKLLGHLAGLTPRREYYPSHLRAMQSIEWKSDLGELAQHDDFQVLVQEIVGHASSFSMPHDQAGRVGRNQDRGSLHLLERARLRHAQFHPAEFGGGPVCAAPTPSLYPARDRDSGSSRSGRVYEIAALIRDWPASVPQCSDLYSTVAGWDRVRLSTLPMRNLPCHERLQLAVRDAWGPLYELCRSSDRRRDSYSLMSLFCMIAFHGDEEMDNLRPLLAVGFSAQFADLPAPDFREEAPVLYLQEGDDLIPAKIGHQISRYYPSFPEPPDSEKLSPSEKKKIRDERDRYEAEKESHIQRCQTAVRQQWPCKRPQLPCIPRLDHEKASKECALLCTQWYLNRMFLRFLREVQQRLDALAPAGPADRSPPPAPAAPPRPASVGFRQPSLMDLLVASASQVPAAAVPPLRPPLTFCRPCVPHCYSTDTTSHQLPALISGFCDDSDPHRRRLGEGLRDSLEALETSKWPCPPTSLPVRRDVLDRYCRDLEQQRDTLWTILCRTLTADQRAPAVVAGAVLWPHINVHSILSLLVVHQWSRVPDSWKHTLVTFAQSIASLRRSERLLACCDRDDIDGFFKEADAAGCEGWEAATRPEWLLLEIENNITIRARQAEVAERIINPGSSGNSVLQLNMGEGKTTVITPMVAVVLTNGCEVPQIVVLKPLLRQSLDLLTQRLGGILDRPIYHVPFSRKTALESQTVDDLRVIYKQCQDHRGVLLALPEHILSFRLVGLDLIDRDPRLAPKAIRLEAWLQDHCRKVIDESDEILDPKFQLVYTVGCQQSLDGDSDRWQITQGLLSLVEQQAKELYSRDSSGLDIECHGARYPIFHFLKADTVKTLMDMVLTAIKEQGLPGLPLHLWGRRIRQCAFNFIRFAQPTPQEIQALRDACERGTSFHKLLVLRGLLAYRILRFVLAEKRWLVDYGLHPRRCMMAVPFRAKGIPSENAEFAHPDVAITLTCLSYYYHGLTLDQVRQCFTLLAKKNDPGAEYQHWIQREISSLPEELRLLSAVNLEDAGTFHQILYPHLKYQKGLTDFYLSHVVFPREGKEFPHKLSTSAWDLPSTPCQPRTTGFSGTNDNRFLLPRSAPQRDLPQLLHTNAMVLSLLLRPENRQCILAQDTQGRPLRADQLLGLISQQNPPVRVIVDVGAQILELSNQNVAQRWLSVTESADVEAAFFFDEHDEVVVIDRENHVERLVSSAFRQRIGKCLVFLDQQHSRGVDLKLPSSYRAAVTLGPRLAKDRLVQACNRMRGLGNGQSVMFVIPLQVRHSMVVQTTPIDSLNVIQWALDQTCNIFQNIGPLWALQGLQYHRRQREWDKLLREDSPQQEAFQSIQEPEARTLSQLYAPWDKPEILPIDQIPDTKNPTIHELLQVWRGLGRDMQKGAQLHEEQERQIHHEVQREQEVCRPPAFDPAPHQLHDDIRYFVKHGKFPSNTSSAIQPAFDIFRQTSAARFEYPTNLAPTLSMTADFMHTIQRCNTNQIDEFLKPAHWVLSNTHNQKLLLLSQYEVNELLPDIRASQNTTLHIYTPRTTKTMRSFEKLDFFTLGHGQRPRLPQTTAQDLGLFAGTLYFETFAIYERVRQFLGLVTDKYRDVPEDRVSNEGFVDPETREAYDWPVECPFRVCPLPFLAAILDIRCKSQGYLQTHAGSIVEAMPLTEKHF
ncbi:hypothetical protein BO78DRAFT_423452 [Aspergillus sclerotiicarbonarius CBS 121057]|uniref:ubiquitinyl hydrolase 1 n=1 Tax=Aspergillus sclerotiicarbonarius (strain CBS 121057 / IBT 28362) TaxID=1448318 RepID=A0A319ECM7_ASPSB|nr:hypothetical protein BO78DRAFT_423452 [Aspergillus sclerotiicarbonarius CBS 121057]